MNRVAIALFALVTVAVALPQGASEKPLIKIVKQKNAEPQPDGSYSYSYETENGIVAEESAIGDPEIDFKLVTGSYFYTAPDGTPIQVVYSADDDGFQPTGEHLPVPPPIPVQIQRALDYIATHPQKEEESN